MFYYAGKILNCFLKNEKESNREPIIILNLYNKILPVSIIDGESDDKIGFEIDEIAHRFGSNFSKYKYNEDEEKPYYRMGKLYLKNGSKYYGYKKDVINRAFSNILLSENQYNVKYFYNTFQTFLEHFNLENLYEKLRDIIKDNEIKKYDPSFIISSVNDLTNDSTYFMAVKCTEIIDNKIDLNYENKKWIIYSCWIYAMSWYLSGWSLNESEEKSIERVSKFIEEHSIKPFNNPHTMITFNDALPINYKQIFYNDRTYADNLLIYADRITNFLYCLGKFVGGRIVSNDLYLISSVEENLKFEKIPYDSTGYSYIRYKYFFKYVNLVQIGFEKISFDISDKESLKNVYVFLLKFISFIAEIRFEHMKEDDTKLVDLTYEKINKLYSKETGVYQFISSLDNIIDKIIKDCKIKIIETYHEIFFYDLSCFRAGLVSSGGYLADILFRGLINENITSVFYWIDNYKNVKDKITKSYNDSKSKMISDVENKIVEWQKWFNGEKGEDPDYEDNPFVMNDGLIWQEKTYTESQKNIVELFYDCKQNIIAYGTYKYELYFNLCNQFIVENNFICDMSINKSIFSAMKEIRQNLKDDIRYVDKIIDRNIHRRYFELQWILDDLESFPSLLKTSDYADENTFGNNENIEYNEKSLNGTPYEGAIKAALNTYSENTGFTMKLVVSDNKLQIYGAQNDFNNVRFITNLVIELEMIEDYQLELVYENDNNNDNNNEFKYLFTIKIMNSN